MRISEHSTKWRELARFVSKTYSTWDSTLAVAVGGSVARGVADENSDVDVFVYCSELPSERMGSAAVKEVGGKGWKRHNKNTGICRDCFLLDDARVDVEYFKEDTTEGILFDVLTLWLQKIGSFNGTDCHIVTCGASEDRVSMLLTETRSNPLQEDTASEVQQTSCFGPFSQAP